jgi:hypothetical protein
MRNMSIQPAGQPRALFFAVLVFEIVFLMAARTPLDSDLWWHLAAGEQTLQRGGPQLVDTFSFTRAGSPWINHSWLGEVGLALAYRAAGWAGLSVLVALVAAASMTLVYRQMSGPPLWRAFLIVPAALVAAPVWSARPQLFSLLLLALINELVLNYEQGGKDRLFLLPLLFALWSNLHGGYPLGLILLGCVIAGALFDRILGREEALKPRQILRLAFWSAVCIPAVLLNPNGINMWRIPFQTVGVGVLQQAIPEWASPDFHDLTQMPFLLLLGGVLAAFGLAGKPVRGSQLLQVIVFGGMSLVARRNFGPFAITASPVLAAAGWQVIERLRTSPGLLSHLRGVGVASKPLRNGVQRVLNGMIVALLAIACVAKVGMATRPPFVGAEVSKQFPVGAAAWLKQNAPPGRLFNEYAWGGYLIWAVPEYPVYVDGRTDLYGDEVIGEWLRVMTAEPGWQELLERDQVRLALIAPGQTLGHEMQRTGWRVLYQDSTAVLFGK